MQNQTRKRPIAKRALAVTLIIACGFFAMTALSFLKEPPEEQDAIASSVTVDVMPARMETVQTRLSGYGTVRVRNVTTLAAEVSGRVTAVHPALRPGGIVRKGEVLFTIDSRSLLLNKKGIIKRLAALKRNRTLLKKEFARIQTLFDKARTGSLANVEAAERDYNAARDTVAQLEQRLSLIDLDLERATVKAPFTGRIQSASVEVDQFVSAGTGAITLADDSLLEIVIPLRGERAIRFLDFEETPGSSSWFPPLKRTPVAVSWDGGIASATGRLNRVLRYDAKSRTVLVSILIPESDQGALPIAEGMFCKVEIPGRTLANVFSLPRAAIDPEGRVRLAMDGKLKRVPVETVYRQDETVFVSSGLSDGDLVITNRLDRPTEGTPVILSNRPASRPTDDTAGSGEAS